MARRQSSVTETQWASALLHRLGIHQTPGAVQALVGWAKAEGGHWHNDAQHNPLNTTQEMPGAGNTGSQGNIKVYKDWNQGLDATVKTLRNGKYGGILHALQRGDPNAVASAIGQTPWGTTGGLVARTIGATPRTAGADGTALLRGHAEAFASSLPAAQPNARVELGQKTTFDQAGFDQARKRFVLAGLLAKHGTDSPLFKTGLLSLTPPSPAGFSNTALTSRIVGGATGSASAAAASGGPRGRVAVAAAANRQGAGLSSELKGYVADVAGRARRPLTITTGTNHNRMTVDGNVSDHWDGHAADIAMPVDSLQGDLTAAHALQVAGVPWKEALAMAQRGGLYTLTPDKGRWKGKRVQVIWRTNQGGNHHNHVHIGVR